MISDLLDRFLLPLRRGPLGRPYPDAPATLPPNVRGLPELDTSRCDASADCVSACPTQAITVGGGVWTLDAGRCVFCGDCVRACPRDALKLGDRVELAARARADLLIVIPIQVPR